MEENIGKGRHGGQSNAHGSAHIEFAANPPPPRKRSRPTRGTHDDEASSSGSLAQVQIPPELEYVKNEYIDVETEWPEISPQLVELEQSYGGGLPDLLPLSLYHKHRAVKIWNEEVLFINLSFLFWFQFFSHNYK
jgi:hypothetical protein